VVNCRSYTFADIAEHLLKHHTGLSSSVIYGVWEGIKGAVEEYISEGGSINTDIFHVHPSIQGVFDSLADKYDKSRHKIRINMQPGSLLMNAPAKQRTKKLNAGAKSFIQSVTDIKTGAVNSGLTVGKNIRILGHKLKINGPNPDCGLYFVSPDNSGQRIKVEDSEFAVNNPSEIIAVIPKLNKGKWTIRLVTQYCSNNRTLKTPQIVTFDKVLTVA
jgi:hypothetical protein